MFWLRKTIRGMRLWQWLVLQALLLANLCLVIVFLPVALPEISSLTNSSLSPQGGDVVALAAGGLTDAPAPAALASSPTPGALPPTPSALLPANTSRLALTPDPEATSALVRGSPSAPLSGPQSGAAQTSALPDESQITSIGGQPQSLPLSCEARAAANWAAYFGVAIDEMEFLRRLPTSDNPDFGFVGDVMGRWGQIPPDPYGVHAGPVAVLLRQQGLNAYARHDLTWDDLRAQIAAGRPVIVWVVGHVESGTPVSYTASNGLKTIVARYEHTVILIGYTPDRATFLDGKKIYTRSLDKFLESWAVLGNMAIIRGLLLVK